MRRFLLICGLLIPIIALMCFVVVPRYTSGLIRHHGIDLLTDSKVLSLALTQYFLDQKTTAPGSSTIAPTMSILIKEGYIDRSFFSKPGRDKEVYFVYLRPDMKPSDILIEGYSSKGIVEFKVDGDGIVVPWITNSNGQEK